MSIVETAKAVVRSVTGGKSCGLRRDRCSCGHAEPSNPFPKRAESLDHEWQVRDEEETEAAVVTTYQRVLPFRCWDCGERFEYRPVFATKTETAFKEGSGE